MPLPDKPKGTWNPATSFDATVEEIEVARRRQAITAKNKAEFRRITLDPKNLLTSGQGGSYLDHGLQRWYSGRQMFSDFYVINKKSLAYSIGGFFLPITLLTYFAVSQKNKLEARSRAGLVSSKERSKKVHLF